MQLRCLLPPAAMLLLAACAQPASPQSANITVDAPQPHQVIASPLTITGQARGTWYFEADFPIRLFDAAMQQIASAPATAQSEWMTENFVAFEATLTFTDPGTSNGYLLLEKDNPSGLPEHAGSIIIPVQF